MELFNVMTPPPAPPQIKFIQLLADQDGFNAHGQQCLVEVNGSRSIRLLSSIPLELQKSRQEWQNQTTI